MLWLAGMGLVVVRHLIGQIRLIKSLWPSDTIWIDSPTHCWQVTLYAVKQSTNGASYFSLPRKLQLHLESLKLGKYSMKILPSQFQSTHWGWVVHICVSKLITIGSDNGLLPGRRQAIIWTNAGILLIGPLGTNFSEILIEVLTFSFKKIHWKMLSGKWWPFCICKSWVII